MNYRSDSSGTQDAFCDMALNSHKFLSAGAAGTTYAAYGDNGNPAMVTAVMGDNNAIGFATYGLVSTTSGSEVFSFENTVMGQTSYVAPSHKAVMDAVAGLTSSTTGQYTGYECWHPLILVTNGVPTGQEQFFINWLTNPTNNVAVCAQAGFTSLFQAT